MKVDLVIHNIGELVTCRSDGLAKRGGEMRDIGIVRDGAVAVVAGKIVAAGTSGDVLREIDADEDIDAGGSVVCPGFVDPHTHIVFAGDRLDEFEQKIAGADYLEILEKGGGILSTVKQTRAATADDLVASALRRLDKMLACGTATCEIKTGYGLDIAAEMKMLTVIEELDAAHAVDIVPTFLAAHAVPPEFKNNSAGYVDLVCGEMLPRAWNWFTASRFYGRVPFFADVFCENNAFGLAESRRILEIARSLGFNLKAHVDEFTNLGGSKMAIELGAASIDHLDAISDEEIAALAGSETIGIVTPTVNFNLGSSHFADARKMIDRGCAIALSTDYNPGSAPCPSQPTAMAIACRYQKLLPSEAIAAATINAAYAVGLGEKLGSIETGKQADMLLLDTKDHRDLAYEFGGNLVSKIIKTGVYPGFSN